MDDRFIPDPDRVRRLRLAQGLSKRALGQRAGLSPHSVIKAEEGKPLMPSTAARLAEALGVPLASLQAPEPDVEVRPIRVVRRPREAWAMQNTTASRTSMMEWLSGLGWRVSTDGPDVVAERPTGMSWNERVRIPPGYCAVVEAGLLRVLSPTDFDEIYTVWIV